MKVIKHILLTLGIIFIMAACSDEEFIGVTLYNGPAFVRFHLILDSDSVPYENYIRNDKIATEAYTHKSLRTIKVPVLLTSSNIENNITVQYSVTKEGDFSDYEIMPSNGLVFKDSQLSDTIKILFNKRWQNEKPTKLTLKLESSDDESVYIGNLNDSMANKQLDISLGEISTTASFNTNRIEIEGIKGETFDFSIDFAKGMTIDEIENLELFEATNSFLYSLIRQPINKGDVKINYSCTLLENINLDDVFFESLLVLREDNNYIPIGNTVLQIVKPIKVERDKNASPASHFYNLNDPYYRTYMEMWFYDEGDAVSEWKYSSQFTYPVIVDAGDPNGVLYSDGETTDPSDDVYHHAFKVRFDSPNAGRTTNSFGLKGIFNNEYTDSDKSPGFNIAEALEFYPKNGNNPEEGTVLVISQFLTISSKDDKQYIIGIKGSGNYFKVSDDLWEIVLTVEFTNDELWGGTQTIHYHMYNSKNYQEPDLLDFEGVKPVNL